MQGDEIFKAVNDALDALNKASDKDRAKAAQNLDAACVARDKEIARRIAAHDED